MSKKETYGLNDGFIRLSKIPEKMIVDFSCRTKNPEEFILQKFHISNPNRAKKRLGKFKYN